jgi:3-isopropylmalate/(R)-2-methylmalate dehydratase small subunit
MMNLERDRWVFKGRCWKFGDNVPNDGGLMDREAMQSEHLAYNPEKLAPFVLNKIRPEFAAECRPGDVAVFGKRFAHGNAHIQGPLGLKGLGVAVVVEGLQGSAYRLLISAGVPFLPFAEGILERVEDGDRVQVNIETGAFENLTRSEKVQFEPLPEFLLEIIAAGGSEAHLDKRLKQEGKIPA